MIGWDWNGRWRWKRQRSYGNISVILIHSPVNSSLVPQESVQFDSLILIHSSVNSMNPCSRNCDLKLLGWLIRLFAAKDEIYCLFQGLLTNLGSLRQQYGLSKSADESVLVIEAYRALRDRAPYPPSFMLAHLAGSFTFVLFDKSTSSVLVASVRSSSPPSLNSSMLLRSMHGLTG